MTPQVLLRHSLGGERPCGDSLRRTAEGGYPHMIFFPAPAEFSCAGAHAGLDRQGVLAQTFRLRELS
jgi:hypothetical protein